ncbi:MAG: extracellular solute-binding protein [Desulfofustis sp.]|nr:extracellular solute-binding protein [Desulfofustis sp.]
MKLFAGLFLSAMLLATPVAGLTECKVTGSGEVNVISNSYPSLEVVNGAMEECAGGELKVNAKMTTEHKEETNQALAASSSPYDLAQVSNSTIPPLQAAGQLQSMNDLVDIYKSEYNIEDAMLISFGGEIQAIAFQVNCQHLFYRKDLLEKHNIAVPTTYEEVIAAAAKLKSEESIEFPLGGTYKSGWNLAQEFVNLFLAAGGEFFQPGSALPAFNSNQGVESLELMKKLMGYMSPNALALDSTAVMQQFQQGQIAIANLWASRAVKMDDESESTVVGKIDFAPAPALVAGGAPATTLWWDGYVLPKNMDGDRDLAFRVLMEGIKEDVVKANNDITIWLRSVYQATRFSKGAYESAKAGAPPYPMKPQIGLVHSAIGSNIGDFLSGKESAQDSLADAEAAYLAAAKEKGYVR